MRGLLLALALVPSPAAAAGGAALAGGILGGIGVSPQDALADYTVKIRIVNSAHVDGHPTGETWSGTCSGILINPNTVLTAGHCFVGESNASGRPVAYRSVDVVVLLRGGAKRQGVKTIHPSYDHRPSPTVPASGADLAVVRLDAPAPADITPAVLASWKDEPREGARLLLAGYGLSREKPQASDLCAQGAQAPAPPACLRRVTVASRGYVRPGLLCAGDGPCDGSASGAGATGAWHGDSGGPASWDESSTQPRKVVGVIVGSTGGANWITDVRRFRDWIDALAAAP